MTTMPSATWYHRWLGWHAPALRQGLVAFAIGTAAGLIGALFHPWQVATLAMVASIDTWRLWSLTWNATPGDHQIRVRATDNEGETQTSQEEPPAPNGATGWHTIHVSVS